MVAEARLLRSSIACPSIKEARERDVSGRVQLGLASGITQHTKRKMKSMVVKVSVSFLNDYDDAQLGVAVSAILGDMTNNPSYPTPTPSLADVTAANDAFGIALANAANGGQLEIATKNKRREELVALVRNLASYVQVACKGDLEVLISSGFPIQKPQRERIGVLPAPARVALTLGPRSGDLRTSAERIAGAAIYNWQLTTVANPTVVLQSAQTTAANVTFSGLTPGVVYRVVANVVGSAGPSSWSDPATQMAL